MVTKTRLGICGDDREVQSALLVADISKRQTLTPHSLKTQTSGDRFQYLHQQNSYQKTLSTAKKQAFRVYGLYKYEPKHYPEALGPS